MDCLTRTADANRMLVEFCAGRLSSADTLRLEEHLRVCPSCAELARGQATVWSALEEWKVPAPSEGFDDALLRRIAMEERPARGTNRFGSWSWLWRPALPAVVSVFALAAILIVRTPGPATIGPTSAAIPEAVDAAQLELALDDLDMLRQIPPAAAPNDL